MNSDPGNTTQKNYPESREGYKGHNEGHKGHNEWRDNETTLIINAIKDTPVISLPQLSKQCGLTVKATRILLDKLRGEGIIKRIGPKYGGRWEVTDQSQAGEDAGE